MAAFWHPPWRVFVMTRSIPEYDQNDPSDLLASTDSELL